MNSPEKQNRKCSQDILKSQKQDKSITQLVQLINLPNNSYLNSQNNLSNQIMQNILTHQQKDKTPINQGSILTPSLNSMSMQTEQKQVSDDRIQLNKQSQYSQLQRLLSNSKIGSLTPQSANKAMLNESEESLNFVYQSKYFNSSTPKQVKLQKISQNSKSSKVIKQIFEQNHQSKLTPKQNSHVKNMNNNNTSQKILQMIDNKANEIISKYSPCRNNSLNIVLNHHNNQGPQNNTSFQNNQSNINNLSLKNNGSFQTKINYRNKQNNPFSILNINDVTNSPFNEQIKLLKTKTHKNRSLQKLNTDQRLQTIETKEFIERNFISPFGDSQFDLVNPIQWDYKKQIEVSQIKKRRSTNNLDAISPISNRKSNGENKQQSDQLDFSEKLNEQQNSPKIELSQIQQKQQENNQSSQIDFNSLPIHLDLNHNQQDKQNQQPQNQITPKNKQIIIEKQEKNNLQSQDIAYNRFILNKQNPSKLDSKRKEERRQSPEKNNSKNTNVSNNSIEKIKQKQQQMQNIKKKEFKSQNQLSRGASNLYEEGGSQMFLNSPDILNQKSSLANLPQIDYQNQLISKSLKRNNSKSMPDIVFQHNKAGVVYTSKKADLPIITSQSNLNIPPTLTALENVNVEQGREFIQRSNNQKRKTENYKSLNNVNQKISRQQTVDLNNRKFISQAEIKLFKDDQINLNSNKMNNQHQSVLKKDEATRNKPKPSQSLHFKDIDDIEDIEDSQEDEENSKENKIEKKSKLQRNQSMQVQFEQELIQSIRHIKVLINQDDQMKLFISTFCFIGIDEFCFLLGIFLDSIYDIQTENISSTNNLAIKMKPKSNGQSMNVISSQRVLPLQNQQIQNQGSITNINMTTENHALNETSVLTQSIKLPAYALDKIGQLLRQSFIYSKVEDIEDKIEIFNQNKNILLPDNLLDEIGGRAFIEKIFVVFFEEIIYSKEFLRDIYEEQYKVIMDKVTNPEFSKIYIQIICEFLKENTDNLISDQMKDKIKSLGIQLSSIDFFVLKKRLYHFLIKQNLVITKQQILKIISRLNQLRQVICNEIIFIRNPANLERHIFLSLKSYLVSTHFVKSASQQSLTELTNQIINYITLQITPDAFLNYLNSIVQEGNFEKFIDSLEFLTIQAFEIYSYLNIEDKSDLKQKFSILRQKLGYEKYIIQVFPVPLSVLLQELSEWVITQITEEPLPKEILLKNLENTEMLEILIEFSDPEIDAFNFHDSYAAFSYYNITKLQYMFWVQGFISVLSKYNLPQSDIQIAENFLKQLFLDRQTNKQSNNKQNNVPEQIPNEQINLQNDQSN